jgi:hypothetical protein
MTKHFGDDMTDCSERFKIYSDFGKTSVEPYKNTLSGDIEEIRVTDYSKVYNPIIIELKDRLFYMEGSDMHSQKGNLISKIKNKDLTILMKPFSSFQDINIDIPNEDYYNSVLDYLKNGETPAIILSEYHLDRLMVETLRGGPKQSRIFMQMDTEVGLRYYKNDNELVRLVDEINPNNIEIGGAWLGKTEEELINWDLDESSWEDSGNSGFVDMLYLLFRDKYPTSIANDLVLRS